MSRRKFANEEVDLKEDVQKVDSEDYPRQIKKCARQIQTQKEDDQDRGSFKLTQELPSEKEIKKGDKLDIGSIFAAQTKDSKKSQIVFGDNKLQEENKIVFKFDHVAAPRRSKRLQSKAHQQIVSENPLCSRKSVTNYKDSQEEEELKFVSLFQIKGNSKFKGQCQKFEEQVKQGANEKKPEKKVVDLFGYDKSKTEPLKEIKKDEKTENKPQPPTTSGGFVFIPNMSVKFDFKKAVAASKEEVKEPKQDAETKSQTSESQEDKASNMEDPLSQKSADTPHVKPAENSQSQSEKLFQKQIESMTLQVDAQAAPEPLKERSLNSNEEVKEQSRTPKNMEHGYLSIESIETDTEKKNCLILRSYAGIVLYQGYIIKSEDEKKRLKVRHMKSEDPEKNRKYEVKIQIIEKQMTQKAEKQTWILKMLSEADAKDFSQIYQSLLQ